MLQKISDSPHGVQRHPFRLKRRPEERVQVLGSVVDLVKTPEVFRFVDRAIAANAKPIIANHNLHSLYLTQQDPEVAAFFAKADLIEVDSVPLIIWARLIGRPSRRFHRCTYLDWREEFWFKAVENGWRVFFLGSTDEVCRIASDKLRAEWPGVQIEARHGYFDASSGSAANDEAIRAIHDFKPHILLVGMGMPRQELWVLRNHAALPSCAIFTVGGAFDYEAGVQKPAPRWVGQIGMEWLYRLARNPRRLFRRYCVEPWWLVGPAVQDLVRAARRRFKPVQEARPAIELALFTDHANPDLERPKISAAR